MIRILIAEDSKTVNLLLKAIFEAEPDMQVVGQASNGREAVEMANKLKPDMITMDIRMPEMDGFEATRMIMATQPTRIVVISSSVSDIELKTTFSAIGAGALAVIEKPRGMTHPDFETIRRQLVDTVRTMSEVKVVRRTAPRAQQEPVNIYDSAITPGTLTCDLVAIGCSTGGPPALQHILGQLPLSFPVPILVVQHISPGFIGGMVDWLRGLSLLKIKQAEDGESLKPGTVYFGPDDRHLTITRNSSGLVVRLTTDPPVNGFRPSATPLFESAARVCGNMAVGAILTGMGGDGAAGLLKLRQASGRTFVQDEASSVVYGMPGTAVALGAAQDVINLDEIADYLMRLMGNGAWKDTHSHAQ